MDISGSSFYLQGGEQVRASLSSRVAILTYDFQTHDIHLVKVRCAVTVTYTRNSQHLAQTKGTQTTAFICFDTDYKSQGY